MKNNLAVAVVALAAVALMASIFVFQMGVFEMGASQAALVEYEDARSYDYDAGSVSKEVAATGVARYSDQYHPRTPPRQSYHVYRAFDFGSYTFIVFVGSVVILLWCIWRLTQRLDSMTSFGQKWMNSTF